MIVGRNGLLRISRNCRSCWARLERATFGEAMSPLRTVVAVVIATCVADCATERAQIASYAQNKMVGLTKEAVLACMGTPASKATEGATEVWSYPSGNCTVNVTMIDGKVKQMNYVGPTGGLLSQNEQCFFTVANCTY
jgi:hypothetical protein